MLDAAQRYRDPDRYGPALLPESVGVKRSEQSAFALTEQEIAYLRLVSKFEGVSFSVMIREGLLKYLSERPEAVKSARVRLDLPVSPGQVLEES